MPTRKFVAWDSVGPVAPSQAKAHFFSIDLSAMVLAAVHPVRADDPFLGVPHHVLCPRGRTTTALASGVGLVKPGKLLGIPVEHLHLVWLPIQLGVIARGLIWRGVVPIRQLAAKRIVGVLAAFASRHPLVHPAHTFANGSTKIPGIHRNAPVVVVDRSYGGNPNKRLLPDLVGPLETVHARFCGPDQYHVLGALRVAFCPEQGEA
jgi:hypothetical protein